MQDENTPQEEEEVEGHHRSRTGPEETGKHFERDDPGKHFERGESGDDDEVEAHVRPRNLSPEEPGKHF